jgi:hypothetical protein
LALIYNCAKKKIRRMKSLFIEAGEKNH